MEQGCEKMRNAVSLTPIRRKILAFIESYSQANKGLCPSYREIGAAVGRSSSSTINRHIERLERDGHVTRDPIAPFRCIRVVGTPVSMDEADFLRAQIVDIKAAFGEWRHLYAVWLPGDRHYTLVAAAWERLTLLLGSEP